MTRPLKLVGGAIVLMLVLIAGLYSYRSIMSWDGRTPEGYQLLTFVPNASGFEPATLPAGPSLANQSASDLAINFGYKVGGISYSYSLGLNFPAKTDQGHATMTVRHATRSASVDTAAIRRWDEPRKAFAVALQGQFAVDPGVPALCIKAVVGPKPDVYDLKDGSICVAERDANGACHPETLACGLIRQ